MKAPFKNNWTGVRWLLRAHGACGSDSPSNGFEEGVADRGAHVLNANVCWRFRDVETHTVSVGSGTGPCAITPTLPRGIFVVIVSRVSSHSPCCARIFFLHYRLRLCDAFSGAAAAAAGRGSPPPPRAGVVSLY